MISVGLMMPCRSDQVVVVTALLHDGCYLMNRVERMQLQAVK